MQINMGPQEQTKLAVPKATRPGLLRHLSSQTATNEEVSSGGPVVVVPPRFLLKRSHSYNHSLAASFGQAREELSSRFSDDSILPFESSSPESPYSRSSSPSSEASLETPLTPSSPSADIPSVDSFAFAFDIDGVLVRGGQAIPDAIEAMKVLNGENEYGIKM
jgi:hypothetical protein